MSRTALEWRAPDEGEPIGFTAPEYEQCAVSQ